MSHDIGDLKFQLDGILQEIDTTINFLPKLRDEILTEISTPNLRENKFIELIVKENAIDYEEEIISSLLNQNLNRFLIDNFEKYLGFDYHILNNMNINIRQLILLLDQLQEKDLTELRNGGINYENPELVNLIIQYLDAISSNNRILNMYIFHKKIEENITEREYELKILISWLGESLSSDNRDLYEGIFSNGMFLNILSHESKFGTYLFLKMKSLKNWKLNAKTLLIFFKYMLSAYSRIKKELRYDDIYFLCEKFIEKIYQNDYSESSEDSDLSYDSDGF